MLSQKIWLGFRNLAPEFLVQNGSLVSISKTAFPSITPLGQGIIKQYGAIHLSSMTSVPGTDKSDITIWRPLDYIPDGYGAYASENPPPTLAIDPDATKPADQRVWALTHFIPGLNDNQEIIEGDVITFDEDILPWQVDDSYYTLQAVNNKTAFKSQWECKSFKEVYNDLGLKFRAWCLYDWNAKESGKPKWPRSIGNDNFAKELRLP
jgi:hypothetical protein